MQASDTLNVAGLADAEDPTDLHPDCPLPDPLPSLDVEKIANKFTELEFAVQAKFTEAAVKKGEVIHLSSVSLASLHYEHLNGRDYGDELTPEDVETLQGELLHRRVKFGKRQLSLLQGTPQAYATYGEVDYMPSRKDKPNRFRVKFDHIGIFFAFTLSACSRGR